jgi:hypothetical protein
MKAARSSTVTVCIWLAPAGGSMAAPATKREARLGFLTVVEDPQHGVFGGFLVLNAAGRPLEFHCSTPVKPNRAQEILYGATLRPYLYGEQIGGTLVAKAAASPEVLCVDLPEVLAVRPHVQPPTVLLMAGDSSGAAQVRVDPPHGTAGLNWFHIGRHAAAVHREFAEDQQLVASHLESLAEFDLTEPFARIREAIEEAQRGNR